MRSKLLLSTAALLAGVALASAQNMPGGGQSGGAAGASQSGGAAGAGPSGAGQERQSPSTQGQRAQDKPGQMQQGQKEQTTQGKDRDMDKSQRGQRDQKEKATQGKDRDMDKSQRGQREDRDKDKAQRGQRDQTTGQREGQREQGQRDRDQSPKQGQKDQDRRDQQGQAKQDRDGGKTTLSSEQRTKIRTTVLNSGPRASNVNFSVSVGTVVPTSVRVVAVPAVLVEIHPEWRGLMYFIVGDQIIIVDRNHRIVAILEV